MNAKEALRHILTSQIPQRSGPNSDLLTHHEMELQSPTSPRRHLAESRLIYSDSKQRPRGCPRGGPRAQPSSGGATSN